MIGRHDRKTVVRKLLKKNGPEKEQIAVVAEIHNDLPCGLLIGVISPFVQRVNHALPGCGTDSRFVVQDAVKRHDADPKIPRKLAHVDFRYKPQNR